MEENTSKPIPAFPSESRNAKKVFYVIIATIAITALLVILL